MIYYKQEPVGFRPRFEVVCCYVQVHGKILLLKRHPNKPEGGTWCTPAGKVEDASLLDAIVRELFEETGIRSSEPPYFVKSFNVRFSEGYDFVYHTFALVLDVMPAVVLNPVEHTEFAWATPFEALSFDLIQDEGNVIKNIYELP